MAATQGTKPARRRLSAVDRRAEILDAALDVFSSRGYHAASIDEIAGVAGISKALIYEHFPSKKELHASLLERHVQEIFERLAESAAGPDPGEVRLRAGVDAFLEWVETHPRLPPPVPRQLRDRRGRAPAALAAAGDLRDRGADGERADRPRPLGHQ